MTTDKTKTTSSNEQVERKNVYRPELRCVVAFVVSFREKRAQRASRADGITIPP